MNKLLLICSFLGMTFLNFAQVTQTKEIVNPSEISKKELLSKGPAKSLPEGLKVHQSSVDQSSSNGSPVELSPNGKLLSVDGFEVDFRLPLDPQISNVCGTKRPYIDNPNGPIKSLGCPFTVPCDDPANRDVANTTIKYFQLVWHVMQSTAGGASSNIDQTRIDGLMAELNTQFASSNMIFCADPATFYVDDVNYTHDSNTEEVSLKTTYVVTPSQFINIYVVGSMTAGGYARFPYDPMGGTSNTGGIVLNRGNLGLGGSTLAHEMGHVFGLEHTFAGVDERTNCSSCYEQVRNVNGSSNVSGAPTPIGGPYLGEGDQEGDWCSDTNPHDTYSYNCSTSPNPNNGCDTNPWANAPVNNHMSYSFCSTQFTAQQTRRMHCMTGTYLGSWIAYGGGVCGAQPPVADFVGTPTTWQAPSNVTFTDLSQPQAIITSWTWIFDTGASGTVTCVGCTGANAQFIGQVPPQVNYPNPGLYTVSLTVTSPNGPDTETKIDYIEVLAPAGDCDTLDLYWVTPVSTPTIYSFGGGEAIFGVPDWTNSPTNGVKGSYERFFSPNPGVTEVGAIRVGLASLFDPNDNMVFQMLVYDDDGFGAPGALLGGSGAISPTAIGVPGGNSFVEFWVPFTPVVPTTATFHVGIEIFPGDATDTLLVISSSNATLQGQGNGLNHLWSETTGYVNALAGIGLDVDLDLYPMLGGYAPRPLITGYTENVVCDTTYVTLFDTALYSTPVSWSITFSDGTVINTTTDPQTIDRVYTVPGPDTVTIATINACGRGDTNTYIIPYNFMPTPSAEFTMASANPVCAGPPGVSFTANVSGYVDYSWDFGDGSPVTSSGNVDNINYVYPTPGLYYVELTVQSPGVLPLDTFYIETFEGGWPAGYDRYNNDPWIPNAGVNPPFTGTNATAWLPMDVDGDGSVEATATSWNTTAGQPADDWMLTTGIGILPANQRLFWDAQSASVNFPDGYEVRISTTQLPANVTNYSALLFSTTAENAFSTTRSVDLSAYAGQTVYIAFRNTSDDMYLLLIDNIKIGTTAPGCSATVLYTDFVEVIDCSVIPPTAVLGTDVSSGCNPLTVTFTDNTVLGDPATTWLWNFGDGSVSTAQNPPPHLYTTAGSYFVTFEACNLGGCTQDTITIFVGDPATIINIATTDPTCAGNDGDITITATGGTGTLQYSIDGGTTFQAGGFFGTLGGATYPIVVQDAIGCQVLGSATLTAPAAPTITGVTFNDPTCFGGNDGDITITATGGTGILQYSIDGGATFQAGNNFMGLTSGIYNIVVQDASLCQATASQTLTDPPQVVITLVTPTDPTCGNSNGSIVITATGGTGGLTYSIDGGTTFQASNSFVGLAAATYNIVVQDASSCQVTSTITLTDIPGATITGVASTDPSCNGSADGTITITATGGTGTLQYSIDGGTTFQASNAFTGLIAGVYNIVVEDANLCQATSTVTLVDPTVVSITGVASTAPSCNGSADGTITITATGGTGALQFSIDGGTTFQAGNNFTGLIAGIYNIVVQDANLCQVTSTVTLVDPTALVITSTTPVDPTCGASNGSITINATGGTGTLQYSIDGGATFQASNIFTGLGAALYNIVVEDANLCQATSTVTLVDLGSPTITSVTPTDPTCGSANGDITIVATGGTGTLQYSIDGGTTFQASNIFTGLIAGVYNIVVEDANLCQVTSTITLTDAGGATITSATGNDPTCFGGNDGDITIVATGGVGALQYSIDGGATFQAGNNFTGLIAGIYNIVVEDANLCQTVSTVTLVDPAAVAITSTTPVDPTCGLTNGTITIVATGGTGALQFSIDGGTTFQASNVFAGLGAALYNIVVQDANLCQVTSTVTLADLGSPTITSVTPTDPTCGSANGDITIVATGGTGALQYSIDGGTTFQASNIFTGLIAGVYNIVVEDANLCQVTSTVTLTDAGGATITSVIGNDPSCFGGNDGDITITAAGGTGSLTYSIDGGATFQAGNNFTGLTSGVYNIVVEDAIACQANSTYTVVDPAVISITTVVPTDPTCNGNADGSIVITATGGTGALTYSIDAGTTFQAGSSFTGLIAGVYNIVVQDANGCQTTSTSTLVDPTAITYTATIIPENCGAFDGQIDLVGAGGDGGPYTYSIDGGTTFQASGTFPGLAVGPYNIVVQDGSSCQLVAIETVGGTGGATITGIVEDVSLVCNADCNGQLTATVIGGILPYVYSWTDGLGNPVGGNSATINALCADSYTLTVVDNNGTGCTSVMTYTLVEPTAVTFTVASTDEACGLLDGTITFSGAAGGDGGPYTYSIDNGTTFLGTATFTGLAAAIYNVVVQDASGCQTTNTVTVNSIVGPSIGSVAVTDPTCGLANGDITVAATGGTGALTYSIDGGTTFQAGNNFTGLIATTYSVVVQDANNCQTTSTPTLFDLGLPVISSTTDVSPLCNGDINGSITITATGGTGVLTYSIDGGTTLVASNSFTGLAGNVYSIVVEDVNGCQATATSTLVDPPVVAISSAVSNDPTCGGTNGDITITATGGTGALTYSIDGGTTFQAGNNFTGLSANVFNIVVQDANNCQAISTITLSDLGAPTITTLVSNDPTCGIANGDITITATGGTGALTYSIDGGTTFQAGNNFTGLSATVFNIVVQDANGCQATSTSTLTDLGVPTISSTTDVNPLCSGDLTGSILITATGGTGALTYSVDGGTTLDASNSFTGLGANTYSIVVEDANGCQVTATSTLVDPAAVIISSATGADPSCNSITDGTITITATGGVGALTYSMDGGATFQTTGAFTGLGANTYAVVVQDANNCQATSSVTLTDPAVMTISSVTPIDPTCGTANGDITIAATGGTGALQYSIDNGATFQGGNNFMGLLPAVFPIIVQDANGCQATASATLTDLGAPVISNVVSNNPSCGLPNGDITITATGGTGTLQYSVDGGITFQASSSFTGLAANTYNIVVEDANGCQVTSTSTLVSGNVPSITNVIVTDPTCGLSNGAINITAAGGTGSLSYSIDNGTSFVASNIFTGLPGATYTVVVQDANGCQATSTATLATTTSPVISNVGSTDPTCGLLNGDITITAAGGSGTLIYSINNGTTFQALSTFAAVGAGVYLIIVEDANGCQDNSTITLTDPGSPTISNIVTSDPTCGLSNGNIIITATGGTGTIQYSIDGGATFQASGSFSGLTAAVYNVVIQDASGCQTTSTAILIDNGSPIITAVNFTDPSCGNTNGSISVVASGGTGALTYSNDGGATFQGSSGFTGLIPGTYNIVVQDASGCSATSTVTLTGGTVPVITINSISNLACFGDANGQVDISITGGQAPYQYDWSIDGTGDLDDPQDLTNGVAGVFSVTVVDANGCTDFMTGVISGPPGLILTANANDATIAGNGSINLTVNGGSGPFTYDWDNDGVGDNDDPEDISGLAGNTSYTVTVIDGNGCISTLTVFVGSVVGINEVANEMGVSVYPNPTSGSFMVEFAELSGDVKFEIIDVAGKLVYQDVKYVDAGQPVNLDIRDVESGVYFLRIENDEKKASIRVIKN